MNNLREIKRIIYSLKMHYGMPVTYYYPAGPQTVNLETGKATYTWNSFAIKRAIRLPAKQWRDKSYDLSFIAANKNFTYGGFFDVSEIVMVIDALDMRVEPSNGHHISFDGKRYEIEKINIADHRQAYELVLKECKSGGQE